MSDIQCSNCQGRVTGGCNLCRPVGIPDVQRLQDFGSIPPKGRECPKCHAVMSPNMAVCVNCNGIGGRIA